MSSIKSVAVEIPSDVAVRVTARGTLLRCETHQRADRVCGRGHQSTHRDPCPSETGAPTKQAATDLRRPQ
jgi:hypothetical protein